MNAEVEPAEMAVVAVLVTDNKFEAVVAKIPLVKVSMPETVIGPPAVLVLPFDIVRLL